MGKKKSGKESTVGKVVKAAAATVGIAAMAYEAVQAGRSDRAGHASGDGEDGRARAEDGAQAQALLAGDAGRRPGEGDGVAAGFGAAAATAAVGAARALVHLNHASPELLMTLKKIGRKRAKRIVAHRPFGRVKDLKRVLPKRVYKVVKHQLTV
jgi:DNA uptake protein ComE-like DNA-binding protein